MIPRAAVRARIAVITLFLLMGVMTGSWASRIPTVREQVGANDAVWGLLVLAAPVGTFAALVVVTRLIGRTGARRLAIPGAACLLVVVPITAGAPTPWVLAAALLAQGISTGFLATPMNALAVLVEQQYGRRIMSSFHACFSLGQLGGGLCGAWAASMGLLPFVQLAGTSAVFAGALIATARWLPADRPAPPRTETTPPETTPPETTPPETTRGRPGTTRETAPTEGSTTAATRAPAAAAQPRRRRAGLVTGQLLLLATIALLSSINEGAAVQWSAQYGTITQDAGPGVGALTFTCFSLAMTLSRLVGDRVVDRLGRTRFLRISALLAAVGMAFGLLVGTTWAGFVGFALLGVGSACIVPTVMGLAGNQPGIPTGRGVAIVSWGQWPAFLIGPPLIGAVAVVVGLRLALGVTVLAALTIAVIAGRVREPGHGDRLMQPAVDPARSPAAPE